MFQPYSIEERPTVIPDVMRFTNSICSSQILQMLQSISSDYDIDFNDLVSIYQNSRLKLHLAGNIHYPPPKDIRCKARIRGRGYGHCQCKRRSIKDGLCVRHHKQLQVCIEAGCERGAKGLGACTGHKGLRLGTMEHPIPTTNDAGERVVKWKKPIKFKRRTVQKIKTKKRIKIKKVINNDVKPAATPELSKTYLFNEVESLMNTIDFEDDSITVDTIIKRLQLHLQVDLTTYHTYLEKAIFKCFDKIVNDELKDEADDMPILETDLVKTYYNDTMYLIHKQSNELFNAYKTGKNKGKQKGGPIGYWVGESPTFY